MHPAGQLLRAAHAAAVNACNGGAAVRQHLAAGLPSQGCTHALVLAVGKAAGAMAAAAESMLGRLVVHPNSCCVGPAELHGRPKHIRVLSAEHPTPGPGSAAAGTNLLAAAGQADASTLALVLLSGGASSLSVAPLPGISLADKQHLTKSLLACGASIAEINTVRRRLSLLKGGGLLRALHQARRVETLAISDVPTAGDDPAVIGSGPCTPSTDLPNAALAVLRRFDLLEGLPAHVRAVLFTPPTPRPGELPAHRYRIIASNAMAQKAVAQHLADAGCHVEQLGLISREARDAGADLAARLLAIAGRRLGKPVALVGGGECTVKLGKRPGQGGRCQSFALSAAIALAGTMHSWVMAAGTDGRDGNSPACGALVNGQTIEQAGAQRMDMVQHLDADNAWPLLDRCGTALPGAQTGTNVADLYVGLYWPEAGSA